jgi:hypothetical protein
MTWRLAYGRLVAFFGFPITGRYFDIFCERGVGVFVH